MSSTVIIHHRLRKRGVVLPLLYLLILTTTSSVLLSAPVEGVLTCSDGEDGLTGTNNNNYPPNEAYEIDGLSTDRFTTIQPFLTLSHSQDVMCIFDGFDPSQFCGSDSEDGSNSNSNHGGLPLYIPNTIHWYLHYYVPRRNNSHDDTTTGETTSIQKPKIYMSPPNIVIPFTSNKNDQQDQSLSFQYNISYSGLNIEAAYGAVVEEATESSNNNNNNNNAESNRMNTKVVASVHIYLPTPNSIGTRGSRNEQFPSSYGREILLVTPYFNNNDGVSVSSSPGFYYDDHDPTVMIVGSNTNIVHVINDSNRSLRIHDRSHNDIDNNDETATTATPRNRIYIQKRYDPTASISSTPVCIGGTRGADIEYIAYGTNTYCHIETIVIDNTTTSNNSSSTAINSNCTSLYLSQQPIRSYNKLHTSGTNNTIYMSIVNSATSSGGSSSSSSSPSPSNIKLSHRIQGELYGNDGTLIVDNVQLIQDDNDGGNNNDYYHISDLEMPHGARNNKITLYYNDGDDDGEAAEDEDGIEEEQQEQLLVGQPEIGVNFGNEYYYCHVMDNPAMSSLYDEENAQYFDYYADGNYCHLFAAQEDGASTTNLVGGTDEDDGNNDNAGTIVGGGGGGGSMCFETETTKFVRHNPCYSGGGGNNHGEYYEGEGYYEGPFNGDDEVYGNNGWATSGESQSSSYTSFSIVGIIMITLLSLVIVGVCCCLVCFAIHRLHHHRSNNNGSGGHRRFSPHNWNTKNSNSTTNPSIENSNTTTNITSNQHQAPPEAEEDPQEGQQSQHPSESVQPSSSLVIVQPPMTTSPPQQTEIPMVAAMPFVDAHEDTAVTTTANAVSPPIVNAVLLGDDEK